jgi:hypothetical protein
MYDPVNTLLLWLLQDMTRYDKIKSLIDKFDPDARPALPTAAMIMAGAGVWWLSCRLLPC